MSDNYFDGNGIPEGFALHHHQKDGKVQLVPEGVHKAYGHKGGQAKGHWAYSGN